MGKNKPFQTYRQQLSLLRSRGLSTDVNSIRSLEQYGYYALINGYKNIFLTHDSTGKITHPEIYINGAQFSEIQSLFDFDNDLRCLLYDSLLHYESNLSSFIAYNFSQEHKQPNSYLEIDNYNQNSNNMKNVVNTIGRLYQTIERYSSKKGSNAIKHYVNNYSFVPLWVLLNFVTFGTLNYLYLNIDENIKINIAKEFEKTRNKGYYPKKIKISVNSIENANKIVNIFRNSVAHHDVTFSIKLYKSASTKQIRKDLRITNIQEGNSQAGVFELLLALKLLLPKNIYKQTFKELKDVIDKYETKFNSVRFQAILSEMNFPKNYTDVLKP